ncbi:hypothetical protein D3C76_612810 [compost metagenome]
MVPVRKAGPQQRHGHLRPGGDRLRRRRVDNDEVRRMQVGERHARYEFAVAEVFFRSVQPVIPVEFVRHVPEFRKHETAHFVMAAEFVQHVMVMPSQVAVPRAVLDAPHVAAFAVHQRRVRLRSTADVVERRPRIRVGHHIVDMLAHLFIPVHIKMPRVQVRFDMVPVAGGIVLHETRRVRFFSPAVDPLDPFLGLGQIIHVAEFIPGQAACRFPRFQPPGFIKHDPGKNRRVIVVPLDDLASFAFVSRSRRFAGFTPEAGHILHDEQAKLIRPIQLAGFFRLDVDPREVQPKRLHQENFVPHVLVGRIGEIAGGVKRLVQRTVQVNRLSVQRDPAVIPLPETGGADFANAEIRGDRVLPGSRRQSQLPFVQMRRFRAPQPGLCHLKRGMDRILAGGQRQFFRMLYGPVLKPQGERSRRSILGNDAGRHFYPAVE